MAENQQQNMIPRLLFMHG